MSRVTVAGSLHLDIMVRAPRLPGRDETLMGEAWRSKCGGKGGNQAVAAQRFGAATAFGGRTGADEFGERLRGNLKSAGIDIRCVGVDPTRGSGMSVAIEEAHGEYGAVVVSGANAAIDAAAIAGDWAALWNCAVLLLQNEIPEAANIAAAAAAKAAHSLVVLNAAPARALPEALLEHVDVLVVNRVEASMLAGFAVETAAEGERAAAALARGRRDAIVTLGGEGLALVTRAGAATRLPAHAVQALSSHGAGDCFCGALAARLAQGDSLAHACAYASAAAALFVSTPEAGQASIDDRRVRSLMAG